MADAILDLLRQWKRFVGRKTEQERAARHPHDEGRRRREQPGPLDPIVKRRDVGQFQEIAMRDEAVENIFDLRLERTVLSAAAVEFANRTNQRARRPGAKMPTPPQD